MEHNNPKPLIMKQIRAVFNYFGPASQEIRENMVQVIGPLPPLMALLFVDNYARQYNPIIWLFTWSTALIFAVIVISRYYQLLKEQIESAWDLNSINNVDNSDKSYRKQFWLVRRRLKEYEPNSEPITEYNIEIFPNLSASIWNLIYAIIAYPIMIVFAGSLLELGLIEYIVSIIGGENPPTDTLIGILASMHSSNAINLVGFWLPKLSLNNAVLLSILLLIPGYFISLSSLYMIRATEESYRLLLKHMYIHGIKWEFGNYAILTLITIYMFITI